MKENHWQLAIGNWHLAKGHKWGYRNFETSDKSTNNWWVNDLTLGSGLHNNHHHDPDNWDENVTGKERDYCGKFIKRFLLVERI